MAITITSGASGLFDPATRDSATYFQKIARAFLGIGTAAERSTASAELLDKPDCKVGFTSSNADALANCMKLSGTSSRGVTFPAATVRKITMRLRSSNDADTYVQTVEQDVWGNDGTTPVLGDEQLVRAYMIDAGVYKQMGRVKIHSVVAVEATDGTHSSGTALAAFSSGTSALTFPPCRAVGVLGTAVMQDAFEAGTSPSRMSISAISASAGTAVVNTALGSDGTAVDPPASNDVFAELELWPFAQCKLVLNSTAVEVHARSSLNDVFTHSLEVTIGPIEAVALGA